MLEKHRAETFFTGMATTSDSYYVVKILRIVPSTDPNSAFASGRMGMA
jgi:hypothetical protein